MAMVRHVEHRHQEAFCLMWYACKGCGASERIWNSRDGVTPFGMHCESCGSDNKLHTDWHADEYAPAHKLHYGQRFWRDGTTREAENIMRMRIASGRRQGMGVTPEREAQLIKGAGDDSEGEFRKGWPMLDRYAGNME